MTDEPTRRLVGAPRPAEVLGELSDGQSRVETSPGVARFDRVSERTSGYPEAFSEREGPTLASPNSEALSAQSSLEQRLARAVDRIQQLEADFEFLDTKVLELTSVLETERSRARAARVGRYLLWGAIIAAMTTFWMMLRLRLGTH
jgi:hypothetical protein